MDQLEQSAATGFKSSIESENLLTKKKNSVNDLVELLNPSLFHETE